jgi:YebC/PmpR family DNA-binding regulatory protein
MGRIFETRKSTMFARWDRMAKAFTRAARDIAIAVKAGGPNPDTNAALRRALQNARAVNMPKDKIEAAVKRAAGQSQDDYEVLFYEGYGPHGIPVIVETATDNGTRTVANLRSYFKKNGGSLGTTGSVSYLFKHMGVFRLNPNDLKANQLDLDTLEMELIDHGLDELGESVGEKGDPQIIVRCDFQNFGSVQSAIEARGLTPISTEGAYIASSLVDLSEEAAQDVLKLVDALEQDDDVQRVFHNLR